MNHDIFISYANEDKNIADAVCAQLESKGVRCWVAPRDILPGMEWGEAIVDGIGHARCMVLIFSAKSNESPQTRREVERAVSKGLPVIPFRIEEVLPSKSMEYFLSSHHWLDAITPPVTNHIDNLHQALASLLPALSNNQSEAQTTREPPPYPVPPTAPAPAQTTPAPEPATNDSKPSTRQPLVVIAICLLLACNIGYMVMTANSPQEPTPQEPNPPAVKPEPTDNHKEPGAKNPDKDPAISLPPDVPPAEWEMASWPLTQEQAALRQITAADHFGMEPHVALPLPGGDQVLLNLIPPGQFAMGSQQSSMNVANAFGGRSSSWADEHPLHHVTISDPFYMMQTEVTRRQFLTFVTSTGYQTDAERDGNGTILKDGTWREISWASWLTPGFEQSDNHPAVMISWQDAMAFAQWAQALLPAELSAMHLRLPTEAEWEYCARAGSIAQHPFGHYHPDMPAPANGIDRTFVSFRPGRKHVDWTDGSIFTAPVASFKANPWGLFDMAGNAIEWCLDYHDREFYSRSPSNDPYNDHGPEGKRILRGGSWYSHAGNLRSAVRVGGMPDRATGGNGFRLVLSPAPHTP